MARPVVTAIMLEDLRREGADIRLRKDSLITPAARDWLKQQAVPVTWEEPEAGRVGGGLAAVMDTTLPEMRPIRAMLERMGLLVDVVEPAGGRRGVLEATRRLCEKVGRGQVAKGVVFAHDGPAPVCIANKHRGVRAALGANLPAVEEAVRELGLNVLVIEYPAQTTFQIRQMVDRLARGPTAASGETAAIIEELEQGAARADR